jgi:carboxylesterase type B
MNDYLRNNFPALTPFQLAIIDASYPPAPLSPLPDFILPGPPATGLYWRATANAYGEMRYMCPGLYIASAYRTSFQKSWNYHYNVFDVDNVNKGLGVPHTVEVNAIWGPQYVTGTPPPTYNTTNANIVKVMQGYWTSFIRAHDPNVYRAKGTPYWGHWDALAMNRMRLETNTSAMELVDPGQKARCKYLWSIGPSLHQ